MKNTILALLMGAFISTTNASVLEGIDAEGTLQFSTTTLNNGLLLREDSISANINATTEAFGGAVSVGVGFYDVDGAGTDTDLSVSYARPVNILGEDLYADLSYSKFDCAWGDFDQLALGTVYSLDYVDLGVSAWTEVGGDNQLGLQLGVSKGFELLQEGLVFVPFTEVNFADEFNALEIGITAKYDFGGGKSISAKTSWKDNDADGGYALDGSWGYSVAFGYQF